MLKLRIIPVLTFNGLALVKTRKFGTARMVGNPIQSARVYNSRGVDELVLLDIKATEQNRSLSLEIVKDVLKECYMPVAVGGGIKTIAQISELLKIGADKVVIKSAALSDPAFIKSAVDTFGAQCICIAVDVKRENETYLISHSGNNQILAADFISRMNDLNVGELMVTAVARDGEMSGYDLELAKFVRPLTNLPIIVSGGAGKPEDFLNLFQAADVQAAAAASIFHFTQYTPQDIKMLLDQNGLPVRFQSKWNS